MRPKATSVCGLKLLGEAEERCGAFVVRVCDYCSRPYATSL
jgi:hypothetical protein